MANPIVIVGGGHGGAQMAASLRQEGIDEPIVLVSEEDALPYHRPPLSKAFQKDPAREPQPLRAQTFYDDNAVCLERGIRVTRIDPAARRLSLSDGRGIGYSRLVLATGARARRLQVPGADRGGVLTLRNLDDATRLRMMALDAHDIVVVGGGYIGLETAFVFAALGKSVTVVEAATGILGRASARPVVGHIERKAREQGIDLVTDACVEAIEGDGDRVEAVRLADGRRLPAQLCIVGIGVVPNAELAQAAGIACEDGIVADSAMRTNVPEIFAIGDCAHYYSWHADRRLRLESVQNATDHARHAARAMAGNPGDYREVPWFWSDLGDSKLQIAGIATGVDRCIVSGDADGDAFAVYQFSGRRLVAVETVNRPGDHMIARQLLAAGISPDANDIEAGPRSMKTLLKESPGSLVRG